MRKLRRPMRTFWKSFGVACIVVILVFPFASLIVRKVLLLGLMASVVFAAVFIEY